MKRRFLLITVTVYISVALNQDLSRFKITVVSCMMKWCPPIRIHVIDISLAFNNCPQCLFFIFVICENSLVNRCLTKYTKFIVYLITTVN